MRESIGGVALYNIIFVFIVVTFAILAGTVSYSKGFRVGKNIISALEYAGGYNQTSIIEINRILGNMGYRANTNVLSHKCPVREGKSAIQSQATLNNQKYFYCIYEIMDSNSYYHWGVTTYIYIDVPIISELLQFPIYATSDSYYRFPKAFPEIKDGQKA